MSEIDTTNGGTIARPSIGLVAWLADQADRDSGNLAFEITADQLDKMLSAEDTEDFWQAVESAGTTAGKELEDVPFRADSFTVHKSGESFKAPLGHFVVIHAVKLTDGEPVLINTGSPLVIGVMRWHDMKDRLPVFMVIRGANTPNGRRLYPERVTEQGVPVS